MEPEVLVAGVLAGGLYALVALGLSLGIGVLRLVNIAHGEVIVGGAYAAYAVIERTGWDPLVAMPIAMLAMAAVAYPIQRFLLHDMVMNGPQAALVATFGLAFLGQAFFLGVFEADPRVLPASYAASGADVLGVRVQLSYVVTFVVASLVTVATHLVLSHTRAGAAVRAAAADPHTAEVLGIDVRQVYALTFAATAAIAAAGGVMAGVTQSFGPSSGIGLLLSGFAVVALAGIGRVGPTFVGGLLIGVLQSVAVSWFGGGYREVVVYLAFFLALAIRPTGLLSRGVTA